MDSKKRTALITGITGQDGSYLAKFLLQKGYDVHGLVRRVSTYNRWRIDPLYEHPDYQKNLTLHYGDLSDSSNLARLIENICPDEIYNLAAQSHVGVSFELPEYTTNIVALGTLRILEAIREIRSRTKFYQASSSEMFGNTPPPQNENSSMHPVSPYGIAKLAAHNFTQNYRDAYGIFACSGILFNHESPRRGENFVTRKITIGLAEILAGKRDKIFLGNLDARRDWGYAPDYVEVMWMMLQQEGPDDYVIATGETHSVRDFLNEAFRCVGINDWAPYVAVDEKYQRPVEVHLLQGDASKARERLGWRVKTPFPELVRIMVQADCERLSVGERIIKI